jgi:hypothetical protein
MNSLCISPLARDPTSPRLNIPMRLVEMYKLSIRLTSRLEVLDDNVALHSKSLHNSVEQCKSRNAIYLNVLSSFLFPQVNSNAPLVPRKTSEPKARTINIEFAQSSYCVSGQRWLDLNDVRAKMPIITLHDIKPLGLRRTCFLTPVIGRRRDLQ